MSRIYDVFTITCLKKLSAILADDKAIQEAIQGFQNNNQVIDRYCFNVISDASNWTTDELLSLSSAIAEAIFQTLLHYANEPENIVIKAHLTLDEFKTSIIPELTKNTIENNRLQSVTKNISEILIAIEENNPLQLITDNTTKTQNFFTPNQSNFGFFATVGLGITLGVGVATYAFMK